MSVDDARARQQQLRDMAAGDGLDMRFDLTRGANTFDAHRVLQLAAEHGLQTEMKERLLRAHHTEGELLSDHDDARAAGRGGRVRRRRDAGERPLRRRGARPTSRPPAASASTRCRPSSSTGASPSPARSRPRSCSSCCARARRSADLDLAAERVGRLEVDPVAAPEAARVVPARRPAIRQQPHRLVGERDQLGAVDGLQRGLAAAIAAGQPLPREPGRARERAAVEALDDLDQLVLVLARRARPRAGAGRRAGCSGRPTSARRRAGRGAGRRAGACRSTRPAASARARRATAAAGGRRARPPCRRG